MPAANTRECFTECIGHKVVGVMFDALPVGRRDLAEGTKTLIFEDGRGLTIFPNGSYGMEQACDITRAVQRAQRELEDTQARLAGVLELAGKVAA